MFIIYNLSLNNLDLLIYFILIVALLIYISLKARDWDKEIIIFNDCISVLYLCIIITLQALNYLNNLLLDNLLRSVCIAYTGIS